MKNLSPNRRRFFRSSVFGLLALSVGETVFGQNSKLVIPEKANEPDLFYRYPAINDEEVSAVVGASHFNFDKVKKLVSNRPELAKASWDWGFGDFESALGAASHVGRRDIAELLISYGARPNIFTYAMMGELQVVEAMVAASPGIQKTRGPHGITLLQHAKYGMLAKDISGEVRRKSEATVKFLESLGDADERAKSLDISEEEKEIYMGEYSWGTGKDESFVVDLNSRGKFLQLSRKGTFGRALNKIDDHLFTPAGAPSVQISFVVENERATSLTIHEPNPVVTAVRTEI